MKAYIDIIITYNSSLTTASSSTLHVNTSIEYLVAKICMQRLPRVYAK